MFLRFHLVIFMKISFFQCFENYYKELLQDAKVTFIDKKIVLFDMVFNLGYVLT